MMSLFVVVNLYIRTYTCISTRTLKMVRGYRENEFITTKRILRKLNYIWRTLDRTQRLLTLGSNTGRP